jgi:hypothetical protein
LSLITSSRLSKEKERQGKRKVEHEWTLGRPKSSRIVERRERKFVSLLSRLKRKRFMSGRSTHP